MPTTIRERISDRLLHTGLELGADRELIARSLRTAACDQRDYQRATDHLLMAQSVDSLLLWLSARLRPRSPLR